MSNRPLRARFARLGPNLVLLITFVFFTAPLVSTARQALQTVPMPLLNWDTLFDKWTLKGVKRIFDEENFWPTLRTSLELAAATVVITLGLLVPTALYVHLRLPRARALVEFLTVLPYVVPPVALAAGVAAFYRANARWFFTSTYALVPFYVIMALPFTYRAIDAGIKAIDVRTLVDASRSLGAGWVTTMRRAVLPNMASSLVSASFLTATVVLGEFTIAVTLAKQTFPTFAFEFFGRDFQGGVALALLTLVATTVLLGTLTLLTRPKAVRAARKADRSARARPSTPLGT
ncbi:MAG TPA: ABC transporter permease subunit [Ilumatobacter sp.]|nr:ABC transporter permease subunit [Ilumatobacter sp.]